MSELFTSAPLPTLDASSARRWAAVGHSNDPDASAAGSAAATAALAGDDPKLLLVFCSGATTWRRCWRRSRARRPARR